MHQPPLNVLILISYFAQKKNQTAKIKKKMIVVGEIFINKNTFLETAIILK